VGEEEISIFCLPVLEGEFPLIEVGEVDGWLDEDWKEEEADFVAAGVVEVGNYLLEEVVAVVVVEVLDSLAKTAWWEGWWEFD